MNKAFFVFKECLQKILNFTCNTSNMIIKYIDYCLIFLISYLFLKIVIKK